MIKRITLALAVVFVFGCPIKPKPPQPPEPPGPPGPVCQAEQYCDCYHNPTGAEWLLAVCAGGQKCNEAKQCVTEPGPGPSPSPDPEPQALIPDEELTATDLGQPSQMWDETAAAIAQYKAAHPEKWRPDGTCLADGADGIDAAYLAISGHLGALHVTAGQSVSAGGKKSDCIFVNRTGTDLYEEMHVFEYARGCAATGSNAMKGVYRRGAGTPPPVSECPYEPCPPKYYPDGTPHWHYNAKPHTMGNCDSTPVVDKAWEFCKAVGLGWMDDEQTVPRGTCPVRVDGHPERVPVENWLLDGGPTIDSRNGQDCRPNHTDNQAAFLCGTNSCRICNRTKTVCSKWM